MSFEVKDLVGLSQPLTKLVEVVSSGMGTLYRPVGIRREATAEAEAIRKIGRAKAEIEATRISEVGKATAERKVALAAANLEIEERARQRLLHREIKRQQNLEAVAEAAVSHLPEKVAEDPLDEDWKARFFGIAEDVSSADMQDLWGRILAGEVARPGSFSLRTLEVMKTLSKRDAEAFQRIRYLALDTGHILRIEAADDLAEFGVSFPDILRLREAGLVAAGDALAAIYQFRPERNFVVLAYNGKGILIERPDSGATEIRFQNYLLTSVGLELLSLIDPSPNHENLKKLAIGYSGRFEFYIGVLGMPSHSYEKLIQN